MKRSILAGIALAGILLSGSVVADNDCVDPVATWQPREVLRHQLEHQGWTVKRIKVDDGCYEVKGIDRRGNKLKAKYAPASLRIYKLEINFRPGGEAFDYLELGRKTR